MSYQLYKLKIQPKSAFVTPLAADTLFGHVCWSVRHHFGENKLKDLLEGYTENKPFIVIGQPFPENKLPRPHLPLELLGFDLSDATRRKSIKKQKWINFQSDLLKQPCKMWGIFATALPHFEQSEEQGQQDWLIENSRMHNSLSRITGSTGDAEQGFSPFQRRLTWFHPKAVFDCYVVIDGSRISVDEIKFIFQQIGAFGYGKEASSGLGKFEVFDISAVEPKFQAKHNAYLTLGPSLPQHDKWQEKHCYYTTLVRFGRHGAQAVYMGSPFKNPILMAESGSVFTPEQMTSRLFIGQGVTGISKTITQAVHQGYAPVLSVEIEQGEIQ